MPRGNRGRKGCAAFFQNKGGFLQEQVIWPQVA
jgi:hypothetical protein